MPKGVEHATSSAGAASPSAGAAGAAVPAPAARYCLRHPKRETLVACGRCERPFCPECLIYTPAGQRCYECAGVRRHAAQQALAGAAAQAFGVTVLGAAIAAASGALLIQLIAAAVAGTVAGRALAPQVNRRTRRALAALAALLLVGGALVGWTAALVLVASARATPSAALVLAAAAFAGQQVGFWVFVAIAAVAGYQRMR